MVCVHSEKEYAIYCVIQGSRYANRTNVTIIVVRSKGTRHDCAEKGTRDLSKLSIVSFHSRLGFTVGDGIFFHTCGFCYHSLHIFIAYTIETINSSVRGRSTYRRGKRKFIHTDRS